MLMNLKIKDGYTQTIEKEQSHVPSALSKTIISSRTDIEKEIGLHQKQSLDNNCAYLQETDYYEKFSSFFDLNGLYSIIKSLNIAQEIVDSIKNIQHPITLLTLGSATPENIHWLAKINGHFREKEHVENDKVIILDINQKSVDLHQKRIDQLDIVSDWSKTIEREECKKRWFIYPQYTVTLWDMRKLPYENKSMHIIIADYTLNFLDSLHDIDKTFAEVHRVLSPEGIFICSVEYSNKAITAQGNTASKEGNLLIHRFQLNEYIAIANNNNLIRAAWDKFLPSEEGKVTLIFTWE